MTDGEISRLAPPTRSKIALAVFWGSAAFLAPWIVALAVVQKKTGTAYHLHVVSGGISLCLLVGMLVTGLLAGRRSPTVLLAAAFSGTLAFITAWFGSTSTEGPAFWVLLAYAVVILIPVCVLSFWTVVVTFRRRLEPVGLPPWVPAAFSAGAATVVVPLVIGLVAIHPSHAAVHLRVVWTGLDCFELGFLIASGVCVWRRSSAISITAMCLATLLFADAWYNISATTGSAETAAIVMALGELPLSGYALYTAHHEVRRWPSATARTRPSPGAATGRPNPSAPASAA